MKTSKTSFEHFLERLPGITAQIPMTVDAAKLVPTDPAAQTTDPILIVFLREYARSSQMIGDQLHAWLADANADRPLPDDAIDLPESKESSALRRERDTKAAAGKNIPVLTPDQVVETLSTEFSQFSERVRQGLVGGKPIIRERPRLAVTKGPLRRLN